MSDSNDDLIVIDPMSVDQLAGAVVLILGAIGSLLLVIWQSKCHCKVNLCYIFSCERRPPNEDEMKGLKDQAKKQNDKLKKMTKKEEDILEKEDEILDEVEKGTPRLIPKTKSNISVEMEPAVSEANQRSEPEPSIKDLT
tara:strand:+ start:1175 stop:1594 length:420 start_codon:yes stop_codon:yes gene_type:complete